MQGDIKTKNTIRVIEENPLPWQGYCLLQHVHKKVMPLKKQSACRKTKRRIRCNNRRKW